MNIYYVNTNGYQAVLVAESEEAAKDHGTKNAQFMDAKDREHRYCHVRRLGVADEGVEPGVVMKDDLLSGLLAGG